MITPADPEYRERPARSNRGSPFKNIWISAQPVSAHFAFWDADFWDRHRCAVERDTPSRRATREGDVYRTLLEKLDEARSALGGQVFDVLGKVQFDGKPLRDLMIEAIRYGEQPEVRARLNQAVAHAFDKSQIQDLIEERALAHDAMDASRVHRIREDMERAEARRLQPHYIESFFLEAFRRLGGRAMQREPRRYQVTHVPASIRNRDRLIGIGDPVVAR